jgi:hypothetical protein
MLIAIATVIGSFGYTGQCVEASAQRVYFVVHVLDHVFGGSDVHYLFFSFP